MGEAIRKPQIKCRVSAEEMKRCAAHAKDQGFGNTSEWLRSLINKDLLKHKLKAVEDTPVGAPKGNKNRAAKK